MRDDMHGSTGPIPVRRHPRASWHPFQEAFYQACVAADFPEDHDMNHPEATGVGALPLNNPHDIRMSTALTYLNPNRHRLNLTIRGNAMVRRVLFDGSRATGVEVESGGERFIMAADEIVLCGGAVSSPHLLMLSGLGPAAHLRAHGIPVVRDVPGVGQNLRNHPSAGVRAGGRWVRYRRRGAEKSGEPALYRQRLQRSQRLANHPNIDQCPGRCVP